MPVGWLVVSHLGGLERGGLVDESGELGRRVGGPHGGQASGLSGAGGLLSASRRLKGHQGAARVGQQLATQEVLVDKIKEKYGRIEACGVK